MFETISVLFGVLLKQLFVVSPLALALELGDRRLGRLSDMRVRVCYYWT